MPSPTKQGNPFGKPSEYLNITPTQDKTRDRALGTITLILRGSNQYFDVESGLHYNTQRYFDPLAARYLTPDPLGLAVGPDLYAFALNRPQSVNDPLGLQPVPTTDWGKASYNQKLTEIVKRAAPKVPDEIGAALLEMVQPQNLAAMGVVLGVWAALHVTPAGLVFDLALLSYGVWAIGSGVFDLFQTLITLDSNAKNAKCEPAIDAAAKALANGLVTSTGEVVTGLAAVWGLKANGGLTRIAKGIKSVVEFAKRQGKNIPLGRGSTGRTIPNNLTEQLAMREAMSNPGAGRELPIPMNDSRWPAKDGWVKVTQSINNIDIHYVKNVRTGAIDDFKFK